MQNQAVGPVHTVWGKRWTKVSMENSGVDYGPLRLRVGERQFRQMVLHVVKPHRSSMLRANQEPSIHAAPRKPSCMPAPQTRCDGHNPNVAKGAGLAAASTLNEASAACMALAQHAEPNPSLCALNAAPWQRGKKGTQSPRVHAPVAPFTLAHFKLSGVGRGMRKAGPHLASQQAQPAGITQTHALIAPCRPHLPTIRLV